MQVVYERCCGLDVHKESVVACRVIPGSTEIRTFGTSTKALKELKAWLEAGACTHVAMESTGVYWKPIFNVLEGAHLTLLLVNARHIKAVPGRKTDVKDAEWIADLLRHGLLRPSFVPDRAHRELRELVRYRRSLVQELAREKNRVQKLLEGANIKLSGTISDVLGVAGRAILTALVAGETDPEVLADTVTTHLKASRVQLITALEGLVGEHQRSMLGMQLRHIDFLAEQIATLDTEVAERLHAEIAIIERLDGIPGVGRRGAEEIIASIGTDMSRFPDAHHLASWAKLCPGNNESAGKRRSGKIGKVDSPLRATLVEAAHAASRKRNSHLAAQYHRLAARRGSKRAAVAVAHSILTIAYYIIRDGTTYQDLGPNYYDERGKEAAIKSAVRRLERLGMTVHLEDAA